MTAVARVAIQDCPMLVADLLLSGPPLPDVAASVPTMDDLSAAFPPAGRCAALHERVVAAALRDPRPIRLGGERPPRQHRSGWLRPRP